MGVTPKTIREWCQTGRLPAIAKAYGTKISYQISLHTIELLLTFQKQEQAVTPQSPKATKREHEELIPIWETAMAQGFINGRAFSEATIKDYCFYVNEFFKRHRKVSIDSLKMDLARIPASQIAKRQHCFKAITCLGKVLIKENALPESF